MLWLVRVLRLRFVSVLRLGLVLGFGVLFREVLGFRVAVVLFVGFGVFGFDRVDSACGWVGWRGYGVLAEGLVVGCCVLVLVLGGLVGVVGVLGDFDGLDGWVGVSGLVSVVVVGVLGRLLDDGVGLGAVVCVVGVLGGLSELDGGVSMGVGVGVVGVVVGIGHGD